jgi:TonB-dependent receptor
MRSSATKALPSFDSRELSVLLRGASMLAFCVAAAAPAYGQTTTAATTQQAEELENTAGQTQGNEEADAPETRIADSTQPEEQSAEGEDDAIVVTGIRQSLQNAQNIKRNADTVVDAITAQDIGALPDRSVTEALQRVPGVAMNRFAASNDPDHFSVEGSGVVVRGLSFVRSEFNGRDTFSTGVYGQAINFQDVPADLLGSVEVYKNATAEMIEGGLSGTVNMNLRLPFDGKGLRIGYNAEVNYSDMAKKYSPIGSFLISNTWDTGFGRVGLLGAVAISKLKSRSDGIQVTNFQLRNGTYSNVNAPGAGAGICRAPLPSGLDTTGFPSTRDSTGQNSACFNAATGGADGFSDFLPVAYAPIGGQFRRQEYDRLRKGFAAAAQWESLDRRMLLTAQFLRADASERTEEHTFESAPDLSEYNTFPAGCRQNQNAPGGTRPRAECRIGANGQFVYQGNENGGGGYTPPQGRAFSNYEYDENGVFEKGFITLPGVGWRTASSGSATTQVSTGGIQQSLGRTETDTRNVVTDHGLNFKFTPNDRWAFNADAQYVKARRDQFQLSVFGSTFADQEIDLTGNLPVVIPHKPLTLSATWAAPNPAMAAATDQQYFTDPRFTFWRAAMDHLEQSRGTEWAFKGDVAYNFNDDVPFLRRAKFGARYSDRNQDIRNTGYNWAALSEVWSGTPGSKAVFMNETDASRRKLYTFDSFMRGQTPGPVGANYYNGSLIEGYQDASQFFKGVGQMWRASGATQITWVPLAERPNVIAGTPFLPTEMQQVGEENKAAYFMLSFGQDDPIFGNVTVDGNIGVRYVHTQVDSAGIVGVPTKEQLGIASPFSTRCALIPPPPGAPDGTPPSQPGGVCNIGAAAYAQLQQFATGENGPAVAANEYDYFLPSLNLKFGLTEELILRFAASRNLARPGMDQLRNFLTVGSDSSAGFRLTGSSGNPFLKPAVSDNFDASLEWYFARVGSLTLNAFYKKIHNFFYQDVVERQLTSGGVTQTVHVRGPANFEGTGWVKGFEVAYQQTFDFLPGLLSGLGAQASYTHIKSRGLPQQNTFNAENSPLGVQGNLPLEQLSKHNVNASVFYEKGPISLRAAYNWRSRFLLTSSDVIFPYYPIFNEEAGYLDASAFLTVHPNIKVGVQGVNLLNTVTKTTQQFSPEGLIGPRSYFMNDRRFAFIVRGSF